ncbi:DHA2 family efflux MFS transporter permease subunit [Acetobacter tropicalis]|uniref:DSBA oxidoreductase n=3 Tax=Acetobacter TaxID=434 RepID=A0A0U5B500_9PROT|nr:MULTISPECIES: DHA2 family efflux MFS transporter permease subunit [Acetobacter]ATJ91239.1 EmrB/QacA family drug resistance transporter [Acetobacter tropicalis]KXV57634.1 disulfide bond formation protein DsbA [Acetobacter senegalensis]MCC6104921.1 DHA2 family efflux MFS transporter permease subunit [Acetobacter sp.]MCG4252853.1 DHA2 family efflux MFS transporter permease subunit [Acetobacter senegalensis]MCG4258739.1 DHA2 family efflux MFS transporter permease subunit [Acetobacter senegalens
MSGQADAAAAGWKPTHNPWTVAFVVTMAAFMEILDTTIVNVSLPHIAGSLSSTYDDATWTLTAYLVANGIVLTISGWLGKVFGRKRYFMICIVMFTVSSFLCGMATSLVELILFRMMQGFFGGGLQPNQQSIILDSFPPEKRAAAFGLTAIAAVVGPVIGPTLGGWITDNFSWRWIFFINVPFGFLTTVGVATVVEDPPWAQKRKAPIDIIGISLITLGFSCLEVMVDRGEDADWFGSNFIRVMGVLAVVGLVGAVLWLLHTDRPAVDLRVFKDRNFAVGTALMGAMGALLYASAIIVPQFAQQVMGYTATLSGLILSPGGIAVIVLIPIVGKLMTLMSVRSVIALGFGLMGLALFSSANLVPMLDFKHLVLFRMSQTACLAFLFVPLSTIAYSTIPERLNADASALFSMSRNVLGSLAISGATALLMERKQAHQAHMVQWMTPYHQPYNDYFDQAKTVAQARGATEHAAEGIAQHVQYLEFSRQVAMLTYNEVFMILGIGAFLCIPFCFLFTPIRGGGKPGAAH